MKHFVSQLLTFFRVCYTLVKTANQWLNSQKGETFIMKIKGHTVYVSITCNTENQKLDSKQAVENTATEVVIPDPCSMETVPVSEFTKEDNDDAEE